MSIVVGLFLLLAGLASVLPLAPNYYPLPIRVILWMLWFAVFVLEKQGAWVIK
jgi:hypothetical protein